MNETYDAIKEQLTDILQGETEEQITVGVGETPDSAYQDILESVPDYASDRLEEKYGQTLNDHEFSFDDELPRIGRPIEHIDTDIDPDVTVLAVQYGPEDTEDEQDNTERRKRGGGSDGSLNGPAAKPTTEFYDI